MSAQDRRSAMDVLRQVRRVYVDCDGAHGVTVLRVSKQEVAALIRSTAWLRGYHLVARRDLGNAALLSRCENHEECYKWGEE